MTDNITIRPTKDLDVDRIMEIVHDAQGYFRANGIDQWQNNYPRADVIRGDMARGESYVLEKDGEVVGTFMLSFAGEPTYARIDDGAWMGSDTYAVIHRVALDEQVKGRGYGGLIVRFAEEQCRERDVPVCALRGDTHEQNRSMQRMLTKNGFVRRGIIYLADGARRVAFEKIL